MFSSESPHPSDSNEYTQYTIFNTKKKKITLDYPKSAAMGFFSCGLKHKFETAMVNQPSVFEPLKFYCIYSSSDKHLFSLDLTLKAPKMKTAEFANSVDPDEVAHKEPPHLNVHCLPSSL